MKNLFLIALAAFSFSGSIACSSPEPQKETTLKPQAISGPSISIMSYNVENLFDTTHDAGKNDVTYLPLAMKQADPKLMAMCEQLGSEHFKQECRESDWNDAILTTKLERLGQVIRQIDMGRGPDILIMAEVENLNAVEMLRDRELSTLGYQTAVLVEGLDERGIDTAVLSKLKQWDKARLHNVPFVGKNKHETEQAKFTRGILETRLELPDGQKIAVFSVHFPSQSNPGYLRKQALEHLAVLRSKLPKGVLAIAGGDFNISSTEDAREKLFAAASKDWQISHMMGCTGCSGTYYYHTNREWSWFDVLMFDPEMKVGGSASWVVDPASIGTPNDVREQTNQFGSPKRFSAQGGVSDHWPIFAKIVQVKSAALTDSSEAQK